MELDNNNSSLSRNNELVNNIVSEFKAQGIFDQFRRECIADVDTKPAFQNLKSRVESEVKFFLDKQVWKPSMNKNQLREQLRKYINDASYLKLGLDKIVDQVVDPNIYTVFMPRVSDVVKEYMNKKKPKEVGLKDLLPEDLEPVSPSSDKDCSKSASMDSADKNVSEVVAEKIEKKIAEDFKEAQEVPAIKEEKKSSSSSDGSARRTSTSSSRSSHKRSELKKSDSQSNSKTEQDLKSERSSDRSSDRSSENKKSRDKKRSRLSDSHRRSRSHKKSSDTDTSKSRSLSRKRHLSSDKSSDEKLTKKPKLEISEPSKDVEKEESDRDIAAIPDEERVQIVSGDESYGSSPKSEASMTLEDTKKIILNTSVPDEERVQIVSDEDSRDANPNPTMTLEETTKIIFG